MESLPPEMLILIGKYNLPTIYIFKLSIFDGSFKEISIVKASDIEEAVSKFMDHKVDVNLIQDRGDHYYYYDEANWRDIKIYDYNYNLNDDVTFLWTDRYCVH